MKKIIYYKFAGKNIHLPRLIGSFLLFAAILMFFKAGAVMFESWENSKVVNSCLESNPSYEDFDKYCRPIAQEALGVYLRANQTKLNSKQFWSALLGPIASLLTWAAVFVFGIMLYKTGNLVIPIEERITNKPSKRVVQRRKRKK